MAAASGVPAPMTRTRLLPLAAVAASTFALQAASGAAAPKPLIVLDGASAGGYPLAGGGPSGENIRFINRGTFWVAVLVRNRSSQHHADRRANAGAGEQPRQPDARGILPIHAVQRRPPLSVAEHTDVVEAARAGAACGGGDQARLPTRHLRASEDRIDGELEHAHPELPPFGQCCHRRDGHGQVCAAAAAAARGC